MTQLFQIKNGENVDNDAALLIRMGNYHLAFAIASKDSRDLIQLGYYEDQEMNENTLLELVASNAVFEQPFSNIIIGYDYPRSLLLPALYHNNESASDLIDIMYGENGRAQSLKDVIPAWQLCNLFEVPSGIHSCLSDKFPSARFFHQNSIAILNHPTIETGGVLTADLRTGEFAVLLMKNGSLLLAQSYSYQEPVDLVYYLLKICGQFRLSPNEVNIRLSGLIQEDSALFEELYRYFKNIGFREAGWEGANEYPAHFFTALNDLARCV